VIFNQISYEPHCIIAKQVWNEEEKMPDPRIKKLAKVLINYSLDLKPGQQLSIRTNPLASDLALAAYSEAIQAGAHVFPQISLPGFEEIFYKHASDEQLDFISPVRKMIVENFDAQLVIGAEYNTRALSGVDPKRLARFRKLRTSLENIHGSFALLRIALVLY
jgi:aminopeptidase